MAQTVKILHVMRQTEEMRVQSLGWEDPLEKEMASHSSILAWKIPRTEEPGRLTDTFAFTFPDFEFLFPMRPLYLTPVPNRALNFLYG